MRAILSRGNLACLFASVVLLPTTAVRADSQQEVLDRFLITELQSRYALAHDLTDPAMYASVLHRGRRAPWGGALAGQGPRGTARDWRQRPQALRTPGAKEGERSFGALRHVIANSVIDLDGDTAATGVCYVLTVVNRPNRGPEILSVGPYEDENEIEKWMESG